MKTSISRKLQEYLEVIYSLKHEENKKVVRVKDIARRMQVSMPSVTDAMSRLSEMGLVDYQKREYIDLTDKGFKIAKSLYETEQILIKFLTEVLMIDEDVARDEACKIEHDLSPSTIQKLSIFIKFLDTYGVEFIKRFKDYLKDVSDET